MKRIFVWFLILSFSIAAARAQDDATQQQINKLSGQIQDLLEAQATQAKRIEALEKEIGGLRDQLNQPGATANQDDLKKLAVQVEEIDRKRQEDRELILKEIEKLGKVSSPSGHKPTPIPTPIPTVTTNQATGSPAASGKESGYEYKIAAGDTLSIIAKAYRDQGIKVTKDQILKANPGLNPNNLKVGQKIFIPAPTR